MPEQPLIDIPVKTTGIEESFTSIGKFAQDTSGLLDQVRTRGDELANAQVQNFIKLRSELNQLSAKDYTDLLAKMDEVKKKQQEAAQQQVEATAAQKSSLGGIMDWITQVPSGLMGKIPGAGIMGGGLLALLIYGAGETGKIQAEANRLAQIFESSSNQAVGGLQGLAHEFQILEATTGQSRDKFAGVVEVFARMGVPARQVTSDFGDVTKNIASASMAYDAMMERAVGTTAKDFITMMARYNLDGQELIRTYGGIVNAAESSRIGTERFMTSVFDASRTLKTYGVDIGSVSGLLSQVIAQGKEAGVPLEATLAGFQGITQGLANLSQGWKATLGMDILKMRGAAEVSPGAGMMFMETGAMRAGQAGQDAMLRDTLGALNTRLGQMIPSGLNEDQRAVEAYTRLRNMGWGPEAAAQLRDMFMGGRLADIASSTAAIPAEFRKALEAEREKMTPWEQMQRMILLGLSEIARGTFGLVTNILGVLMSYTAYFIGWSQNPLLPMAMRDPAELKLMTAASASAAASFMQAGKNAELVWEGVKHVATGAKMGTQTLWEPMSAPFDALKKYYGTRGAEDARSNAMGATGAGAGYPEANQWEQEFNRIQWQKQKMTTPPSLKTGAAGEEVLGTMGEDQGNLVIKVEKGALTRILLNDEHVKKFMQSQ